MLVAEIKAHREADQIIQGTYGEGNNGDWKGCAVGCSIHSLNRKLGKDSTTKLKKVGEIEEVWDTMFRFLGEKHQVEYIPFPSDPSPLKDTEF